VREAENEVERDVVGIVESRENGEVGYVSDVRDEAGSSPWFEGPTSGGGRRGGSGTGACVEVEHSDNN